MCMLHGLSGNVATKEGRVAFLLETGPGIKVCGPWEVGSLSLGDAANLADHVTQSSLDRCGSEAT
jgi:hypothetical protein